MAQLFAEIRRGKVKPGMAQEFAKRVEAGALPVMKSMDGFKGYYLVFGADDTIIGTARLNRSHRQYSAHTSPLSSWTAMRTLSPRLRRACASAAATRSAMPFDKYGPCRLVPHSAIQALRSGSSVQIVHDIVFSFPAQPPLACGLSASTSIGTGHLTDF